MPDASRVGLRVWVTRDTLRAIERRAAAVHAPREDVAAALLVQALGQPAEPVPKSAQVEPSALTRAAWSDALTANPHLAPLLLQLLGDADR